MVWRKVLFFLLIVFCLTPFALPPVVFAAGLIFALIFKNPYLNRTKKYGEILFKSSFVLFGFGLNHIYFKNALNSGLILMIAVILLTFLIGTLIVKLYKTQRKTYPLIAAAISAGGNDTVSAVSPAIDIEEKDLSAAVSTLFLISAAAILFFPLIGYLLNLTVYQYGIWTAIAIPDILFSLTGASVFGDDALAYSSAINIVKFLFLILTAYVFVFYYKDKKLVKPAVRWILLLFAVTFLIRYYTPLIVPPSFFEAFANLAKAGFTITLFLTALGFSRQTFNNCGIKPLIFGFLLWILLATSVLIAVIRLV